MATTMEGGDPFQRLKAAAHRTLSIEDALSLLAYKGLQSEEVRTLVNNLADDTGVIDVSSLLEQSEGNVVTKALTDDLAMPNWAEFTSDIKTIYHDIQKAPNPGHNADYIPILAEQDPDWFSVSICTVDGQTLSYGNTESSHMFSIQSCIKPMLYAAAVEEHGLKKVHRHVGIEPSGLAFNEVSLNAANRPHNPMINAGAIATGSLVRPGLDMAARFRFFKQLVSDVAGGEKVGFSQPTYLCEQETAWRNNALMYYMTQAGVFAKGIDPLQALDFYIQACSMEVNTRIAANMAATLATGGISPLTQKRCFSPVTTKSCLTLMFSCGLYDYSGEWCIKIGLPAKSGVAGLIYVVIPHVLGMAVYSPPLDSHGNSVRGVEFCKRLLKRYRFGIFDQIVSGMRSANVVRSLAMNATENQDGISGMEKRSPSVVGSRHSQRSTNGNIDAPTRLSAFDENCGADSGPRKVHRKAETAENDPDLNVTRIDEDDVTDNSDDGSVNLDEVEEGCASGGILERWRRVLHTFGRWFKTIRMVSVWCEYAFKSDRSLHSTDWQDHESYLSEPVNEVVTPSVFHFCSMRTIIPRWLPVEYLYRLLAEYGIGPVDGKYTPALYMAITGMIVRSQQRLAEFSAKAKERAEGAMMKQGSPLSEAQLQELLSDLIPWAPQRFDFGLNLSNILDGKTETSELTFSSTWNALSVTQQSWCKTKFTSGSPPDLARRGSSFGNGQYIYIADLFVPEGQTNIIVRAMLNNLSMPDFENFCKDVASIASLAVRELQQQSVNTCSAATAANASSGITAGTVYGDLEIEELIHADASHFGVSVCTVDGQQYNWGDAHVDVPLMSTVHPLLYSLALKDVGVKETHTWVAAEPTSTDPSSFDLMSSETRDKGTQTPRMKPFNPFTDSGALSICSLLGGAHIKGNKKAFRDSGNRFTHILNHITSLAGGRRIGFNNSVFLAQKEKRLQTMAVSHFMKGMGAYPDSTEPTDNAHLLFQAQSMEVNCEKLATIAASLANIGICPTTNECILAKDDMRSLFSLMYNCGLNQYTGTWAFSVGIPASAGVSGTCMIIVPNIMGIAIYSPPLNEFGVSPLALKFCEALTARYRINMFDQLVYRDEDLDIRANEGQINCNRELADANLSQEARSTLLFFELCTAANEGNAELLVQLLEDGAQASQCDYDKRTPLHVAACGGHVAICKLLIDAGADILAVDRWGATPYTEASRINSAGLMSVFEDEVVRQNLVKEGHTTPSKQLKLQSIL